MDDDFQVMLTSTDHQRLKQFQVQNKILVVENAKLKKQQEEHLVKIKVQDKALHVRDSFIQYIMNETDYAFGNILGLDIVSCDISQSVYQDVVTFQQKGVSAIEIRQAIEAYTQKNSRIFERFNAVQDKFAELSAKISTLESNIRIKNLDKLDLLPKIMSNENKNQALLSNSKQLKMEVEKLEKNRQHLLKQSQMLKIKNSKLIKQGEQLCKKLDNKNSKDYAIKLLIDQYYTELEKNLAKIGGLTAIQVGTVIGNQMKGINQYIQNLVKKSAGIK